MKAEARPGTVFVARDYCALPFLYSISDEVKGINPSIKTRYAAGLFLFGRQLVPIVAEPAKPFTDKLKDAREKERYCQVDTHRPNTITVSGPPNEAMIHNVLTALKLGLRKNGYMVFSTSSPYPGEITVMLESPDVVIISGLLHPSEIGVLMDCCNVYMTDVNKLTVSIERPAECGECIENTIKSVVDEIRERLDDDLPKDFERVRFVPGRPKVVAKLNITVESTDDEDLLS